MKKRSAAILTAAVMVILCACTAPANDEKAAVLYDQGLAIVRLMDEMAGSEAYMKLVAPGGSVGEKVQVLAAEEHQEPEAVYSIMISEDTLSALAGFSGSGRMSQELQAFLNQRLLSTIVSQINALDGAETLAAAASCTAQKTFAYESMTQDVIYLYTFADASPAAVIFTAGEDHTVSANGLFILSDSFSCESAGEIEEFFDRMNIKTEVAEVLPGTS